MLSSYGEYSTTNISQDRVGEFFDEITFKKWCTYDFSQNQRKIYAFLWISCVGMK